MARTVNTVAGEPAAILAFENGWSVLVIMPGRDTSRCVAVPSHTLADPVKFGRYLVTENALAMKDAALRSRWVMTDNEVAAFVAAVAERAPIGRAREAAEKADAQLKGITRK